MHWARRFILYQRVLNDDVDWLKDVVAAKQPQRLPTVLTIEEASAVLARLQGEP